MTSTPSKRRKLYLGLAALFLGFALVVYLLLGSFTYVGDNSLLTAFYTVLTFALVLFVMIALAMLVCYTNPRMGDKMAKRLPYIKNAWIVPMKHLGLFGVHPESAIDEKRQATKRMRQRHMRRQYLREQNDKNNDAKS